MTGRRSLTGQRVTGAGLAGGRFIDRSLTGPGLGSRARSRGPRSTLVSRNLSRMARHSASGTDTSDGVPRLTRGEADTLRQRTAPRAASLNQRVGGSIPSRRTLFALVRATLPDAAASRQARGLTDLSRSSSVNRSLPEVSTPHPADFARPPGVGPLPVHAGVQHLPNAALTLRKCTPMRPANSECSELAEVAHRGHHLGNVPQVRTEVTARSPQPHRLWTPVDKLPFSTHPESHRCGHGRWQE